MGQISKIPPKEGNVYQEPPEVTSQIIFLTLNYSTFASIQSFGLALIGSEYIKIHP